MNKRPLLLLASLALLASCGGQTSSSNQSSVESQPASSSQPSEPSSQSQSEPASSESAPESSSQSSEPASSSKESEPVSSSSESSVDGLPKFDKSDIHDSLIVHYHRDDASYASWWLWLWADGGAGDNYYFEYGDSYGAVAVESLSTFSAQKIGLIVRNGDWNKDPDGDRFVTLADYTPDANGNYEIWLYTEVSLIYDAKPTSIAYLSQCDFTNAKTVAVTAGAGKLYKVELLDGKEVVASADLDGVKSTKLNLENEVKIDRQYVLKATFENTYSIEQTVTPSGLYADPSFDEAYYYDGELGAIYSKEETTFKVWSPAANKINLKLYSTGTPKAYEDEDHLGSDTPTETIPMEQGEKGVYSATVKKDLDGVYYTYEVFNYVYPDGKEVVDPYAKAVGVNGLRGEVLDLSKTDPKDFATTSAKAVDRRAMVVYETHIADLTSASSWGGTEKNARKYAGFHEAGTSFTQGDNTVSTGFDHIKELGVNAVQILPMFDQANDETNPEFNWGYNPLNYNVPEGVYSSDPYDGAVRIRELKELIRDYNAEDIHIIMDVVYNHVNSVVGQNFDVLMPYYYFRYNGNALMNGSGCGNETASDRSMFRKFMIDSAVYWAEEYHVGGFRFDLMGLHDLETMKELTKAVEKVNPNAVIYGEPWTGGTSGLAAKDACNQSNQAKFEGFGCFNDVIRDSLIAGGLAAATDKAWATIDVTGADASTLRRYGATTKGKGATLMNGIRGGQSTTDDPMKAVSYATCHDNYTLYDRAQAAYGGKLSEDTAKAMARLAQSVVMTSQGTAFMLAGEEMLRSKGGNSNSYNASYEVNQIDYALKVKHLDLFNSYIKLIDMKKTIPGLHLDEEDAKNLKISKSSDYAILSYEIQGEGEAKYQVVHTNGMYSETSVLDIDFGAGTVIYDSLNSGIDLTQENYQLKPYQTLVVAK